ncbi:hypothetical protein [Nocardia beijingensis]|uniref:hypothetical protein n=1 Tax=Nocardia beijingensis TaxID=95162 RepID=UPI0033BBB72A
MVTAVRRGHPLPRPVVLTLFVYGLGWGALTIAGRGDRWAGPTLQVAQEFAGGPVSWGAALMAFCAAGATGLWLGRLTAVQAALVSCGVWSVAFAICLGAAPVVNSQAALTGAVTWGFHAALFLAAARRVRW